MPSKTRVERVVLSDTKQIILFIFQVFVDQNIILGKYVCFFIEMFKVSLSIHNSHFKGPLHILTLERVVTILSSTNEFQTDKTSTKNKMSTDKSRTDKISTPESTVRKLVRRTTSMATEVRIQHYRTTMFL